MAKPQSQQEVLVCGFAPAAQLSKRLSLLCEPIAVCAAHTPADAQAELERGRHAVCVIEHNVWATDPTKALEKLVEMQDEAAADDELLAALTARIAIRDSGRTAHDLLPALTACSPQTTFVVTCHQRRSGMSTTLRALYKDRPEVIKVMGSLAEWGNVTYVLKLLSRTYLGKSWSPRPVR